MNQALVAQFLFVALAHGLVANPETEPRDRKPDGPIAAQYRQTADTIISAALADNDAWAKLEHLCLRIGHRLSGTSQLEKAIDWAIETLKKDGLVNVRREKVMVPHWVRGDESVTMLEPRHEKLVMLGLGGSIATPAEGITAEVVVVSDEDELNAIGEKANGKIVLFNNVMPPYDPEKGSGYGKAVRYRGRGAQLAASKGGVACLVRSVTARSLRTPHTGAMRYDDNIRKIPAAAITTEDADEIARLHMAGVKVVVNLKMAAKTLPDAESANVVAELRGSTHPDEIIVVSGHIDSWDVGHGAHDDGAGCVISMQAVSLLRKLNLTPKRTIRVVLWTNEENGLAGAKQYAKDHADELSKHVAAIESDSGAFRPEGYSLECENKDREPLAAEQMSEIVSLFSSIGPMKAAIGGSGADISQMKPAGVVLLGHDVEGSKYFDYHHTAADTLDKVDPAELSQNVAVMATVVYILADMPNRLGEPSAPVAESK